VMTPLFSKALMLAFALGLSACAGHSTTRIPPAPAEDYGRGIPSPKIYWDGPSHPPVDQGNVGMSAQIWFRAKA